MTEPEYYLITPEEFRKFYECALIHDMPDAPTIGAFIRSRAAKGESEAVLDNKHKPGCFGAYGLPSCNIPGCIWFARCKQSRSDY